jgi:hypothetical protein
MTDAPFALETSLQLSDGRTTVPVSLPADWTCVRDRGGRVTGLRTVKPPAPRQHPGLALSVTGPRTVRPGSIATFAIRVRNTRRGPHNRYISSLWHIRVQAGLNPPTNRKKVAIAVPPPVVRKLGELRRGKVHVLRIGVQIPNGLLQASIHHVCLSAGAIADSARPADARACVAVRALRVRTPPVGLGSPDQRAPIP